MVPVLTPSSITTLPLVVRSLITPLKVTALPLPTAILLVTPLANLMLLLKVLPLVFSNKAPPLIVITPEDKLVPLAPPVATDSVPPEIVVPPL